MDGIRAVRFDHPDGVKPSGLVQAEYVRRHGYDDMTPLHPGHFDPPGGLFLVAYLAGAAVGCGGWRVQEARDEGMRSGTPS